MVIKECDHPLGWPQYLNKNSNNDGGSYVTRAVYPVTVFRTRKKIMSHYMTALAMKQKNLKPSTKVVLYWIADHYNDDTKACFPSQTRLAQLCEMTRTSVNNHINELKVKNLLKTTQRHRPDGGKSTLGYELLLKNDDVNLLNKVCKNNIHGDVKKLDNNNLINSNLVKLTDRYDEYDFVIFWEMYPRKQGKGAARNSFYKALKKVPFDTIRKALANFVEKTDGQDKQFIPHPSTWLNQERWDDEYVKEDKTTGKYLDDLVKEISLPKIKGE